MFPKESPPLDPKKLYSKLVVEHYRSPRHCGLPPHPTHLGRGVQRMCGDSVQLGLVLGPQGLEAIGHESKGCAISVAAASLACELFARVPPGEWESLTTRFQALVEGKLSPQSDGPLGDLEAFFEVSRFPTRRGCALLPFRALEDALSNPGTMPVEPESESR